MDWTVVIAPVAALIGVFLGQELQKRREVSLRAQQLREEMLLDLAEWTLKQLALVPRPSTLHDRDGNLKDVTWPTNAEAADRNLIAEAAPERLLMLVRLYGSPKLFALARRASAQAEISGSVAKSRRTDIVGPSVYHLAIVALDELWARIDIEVGEPPRRRSGLAARLNPSKRDEASLGADAEDRAYKELMADERWWHVETRGEVEEGSRSASTRI